MSNPLSSIPPGAEILGARPDLNARWQMSEEAVREKARTVAQEFESMFVSEMLRPVFEQIDTDGPFGGGQAEAAFRPLLVEQYSKSIADVGGVGVSDAIMSEILRIQGLEE